MAFTVSISPTFTIAQRHFVATFYSEFTGTGQETLKLRVEQ
jgi:hypothetical protein